MDTDLKTISFLVGNGFDVAILEALGSKHTTTYGEFYDYINWNKSKDNEICKDINENIENWCDFEAALTKKIEEVIQKLKTLSVEKGDILYKKTLSDWAEIQLLFSDFLNEVIPASILKKSGNMRGIDCKTKFLGDLSPDDFKNLKFDIYHHDKVQYNIVNFNYTSLLDNYLTADDDPHPYVHSINNMDFHWPDGSSMTQYSVKSKTRVFHPHGTLSIPSSIKFGNSENVMKYSASEVMRNTSLYRPEMLRKKLNKAYWYQNNPEMQKYVEQTDLFVIYGLAIGPSDKWWWNMVARLVVENNKEVIVYCYDKKKLKEKLNEYVINFIENSCTLEDGINIEEVKKDCEERILTVNFDKNKKLRYGFCF
ncbi:hypothetical protein LKF67_0106 [Lactococcus lactis subsp. lactis]|uniref:AbiH family protein n=1 Tax=Lactococcus lactis TaxID=1358 RepID=UPI00071DCA94|nr:AbiH family protein [Lactococcus lactis]KST95929.1 hypothetical protein LKF67_0106 [Lactococcus lactis subsp. lactis]